jgi:hypothetical protein
MHFVKSDLTKDRILIRLPADLAFLSHRIKAGSIISRTADKAREHRGRSKRGLADVQMLHVDDACTVPIGASGRESEGGSASIAQSPLGPSEE